MLVSLQTRKYILISARHILVEKNHIIIHQPTREPLLNLSLIVETDYDLLVL